MTKKQKKSKKTKKTKKKTTPPAATTLSPQVSSIQVDPFIAKISEEVKEIISEELPFLLRGPEKVVLQTSTTSEERKSQSETPHVDGNTLQESPVSSPPLGKYMGLPQKSFEGEFSVRSEDDKRLEAFKDFLNIQWGRPAVVTLFRSLWSGGYPPFPVFTSWAVPQNVDILELVWRQVQTDSFIDEIWPSLKMVLDDNIFNSQWAAQVATLLAMYNVIKFLPLLVEDMKESEYP